LGGWGSDARSETGVVIGAITIFTADTEEVVAARRVEVVVNRDGNGYPNPEYPTGFTR
jgi:hypothetical protein